MGKMTFDLSPELERALEQIVQSTGRTRNAVVYEALETYVARQDNTVSDHALSSATGIINSNSNGRHEDNQPGAPPDDHLQEPPLSRLKGIISDSDVNSLNINEWLEANWLNHLVDEQGQQPPPIMHQDDAEAQIRARQRGRPFFRSLGTGDNAELQGEESEDWLKANWRPE
jgi:hypothetical protein